MNNYREILLQLLVRGAVAAPIIGLGWYVIGRAAGGWAAVPVLMAGMVCLVLAAIVLATPITRLVVEPTGRLFYPSEHFSRPQPMYGVPESKRAEGDYEAAFGGFDRIARDHPHQLKAYISMVDIAVTDMHNPELARATYRQGMANLRKKRDREALTNMFEGIITRAVKPTLPSPPLQLRTNREETT